MMKRKEYSLTRQAERDLTEGRTELLAHLKSLPPSELHNVDPSTLARLSSAHRQSLFASRNIKRTTASNREASRPHHRLRLMRRIWFKFPIICRSQLIGLTATLGVLTCAWSMDQYGYLVIPYWSNPLPVNTNYWPACKRLNVTVDGCIYTLATSLHWEAAARLLELPLKDLRTHNSHITHAPLQSGDPLVIWRGRRTLKETHS